MGSALVECTALIYQTLKSPVPTANAARRTFYVAKNVSRDQRTTRAAALIRIKNVL